MKAYDEFPARPASEVEWEELLVRYEIGPRALRAALDDAPPAALAGEGVTDALHALVYNEMRTAALLAAMRDRVPLPVQARAEVIPADADDAAERYARLRDRNFNAVQRRGIDVWGWSTDEPGTGTITAYQLLNAALELDRDALARVRESLRGAGVA